MNGPGSILQNERLSKNLTIDIVHRETKIKTEYIEAIERDDVSAFPAELYYKNFLKTYSKYLNVDAAEMINIYEQIKMEKQQELIRLNKKVSLSEKIFKYYEKNKKIIFVLAIAVVVLLFVLCVAHIVRNINAGFSAEETVNYIDDTKFLSQDKESFDSVSLKSKIEEQKNIEAENSLKEIIPVNDTSVVEEESKQTETTEHKKTNSASEDIILQINAKQNCWVKLTSDNRASFEGVLQKDHHYTSRAKNRFILRLGNSEGVDVYFNDNLVDVTKGTGQDKTNTIEFKRD